MLFGLLTLFGDHLLGRQRSIIESLKISLLQLDLL
jgi:hypothetical protein